MPSGESSSSPPSAALLCVLGPMLSLDVGRRTERLRLALATGMLLRPSNDGLGRVLGVEVVTGLDPPPAEMLEPSLEPGRGRAERSASGAGPSVVAR